MTVGAMRPDRSPALQQWLYDLGFLSFSGTMGVFLVGSLIWMTAILLDRNRVFPRWFAYLNLCNALTEVVIAPSWIFQRGVLAWNGVIAWWIDVVVFGFYTVVFIYLLRNMILREDFGTGPLPDLPAKRPRRPRRAGGDCGDVMTTTGDALRAPHAEGRESCSRRTRHVVLRLLRIADLHLVLLRLPVLPHPERARVPPSPVAPPRCGSASSTRSSC